jgi:ankyrin repeat protein
MLLSDYVLPAAGVYIAYRIVYWLLVTNWDSVLLKTAEKGDLKKLQEALSKKAKIETRMEQDITPLIIATINNHSSIISALLAAGASPDTRDEEGRTALMFAAKNGSVEVVQMLLAKGADPNMKSFTGLTPLILAACT